MRIDYRNRGKSAALMLCAAAFASLVTGAAGAHESPRTHVHSGGGLPYPPFTFVNHIYYPGIVYDASAPNTHFTSLDVYVADSSEPPTAPSPVMVWVHGGGLRMSDKAASMDLASKPEYFTTKLGYVFVSINYRLLPEGRYPTNVQDVANALAWVHSNIAEFGGDPEQIFLMGHSAGARLVTQVSTDDAFLKKAGKDLRLLKGVIANEGDYGYIAPGAETRSYETSLGPNWKQALAIEHVKPGKHIPPFLLLHVAGGSQTGNTDRQANEFAKALRAVGVRADVVALDHVEHFGANERLGKGGDVTTGATEAFLGSIPGNKRAPKWIPGSRGGL